MADVTFVVLRTLAFFVYIGYATGISSCNVIRTRPWEAGCWIEEFGRIIAEGQAYVNANCTRRDVCQDDVIISDYGYGCGVNTVCKEVSGCSPLPTNCRDIEGDEDGVHTILPKGWSGEPFHVYCDMSNGGGWTVFQRRIDGSEDFYRNWEGYKQGFGDLSHEFWLGNDHLYALTNQRDESNLIIEYELRVDLVNNLGDGYYSSYPTFRIESESLDYKLSVLGAYSGTAGDPLERNLNFRFSTYDRDNDGGGGIHCAESWYGGWWYRWCGGCNPNGGYFLGGYQRIFWNGIPDSNAGIKEVRMRIRPAQ